MEDPFPLPPGPFAALARPLAERYGLHSLPLHLHEVVFFFALYAGVKRLSPALSTWAAPTVYPRLSARTRLNWDVHVVSFVQSVLIDGVSLWVMWRDREARGSLHGVERVWGYTGATGLIQAMAAGYFAWDFIMTALRIDVFGWGMLAHAASALAVYTLGFRPFVNFYAPVFILFELSSPFLNVHWFLDKLDMTGSRAQWWNGMVLLGTFFCCRLLWGTYSSVRVFLDIIRAIRSPGLPPAFPNPAAASTAAAAATARWSPPLASPTSVSHAAALAAAGDSLSLARLGGPDAGDVPLWLAGAYLAANIILNSLNFYWFNKMVGTVLMRFRELPDKKVIVQVVKAEVDRDGATVVKIEQVTQLRHRNLVAPPGDEQEDTVVA